MATRQHGVVSVPQLRVAGLDRGAIDDRAERGLLHRLHVGVYAVGHHAVDLRGRWMAAVLACDPLPAGDPAAFLSHRAAAALWEMLPWVERPIDVIALRHLRCRVSGIAAHRTRSFASEDAATRHRIPATSAPRTLVDLAAVVPRRRLARAFNEADRLGILDPLELQAVLDRSNGRRGVRYLRGLLARHTGAVPFTRSGLEQRFLAAVRRADLPEPEVNVRVEGIEVDMLWRGPCVVVELDGFEYHRTRSAFEVDRERGNRLQLAGFELLRFTDRDVARDLDRCLAQLAALLDARAR